MKSRRAGVLRLLALGPVACAVTLAACGGSGGSGAPVAPINAPAGATPTARPTGSPTATPTPSPTPITTSSFSVSISLPNGSSGTASRRAPLYVSPGTASVAVYDGKTLIFVGNYTQGSPPSFSTVYASSGPTVVTGGSCTNGSPTATCTVSLVTSIGTHAFDVMTYGNAQTSATPAGVILSEGELAVTLAAGPNPGQMITPLGVADKATFVGPALTARLNGNGAFVGIIGTQYTFQYAIDDASGNQIVQPGNYDNAPVTISETDGGGIVTMTPVSQTAPPASTGMQTFTVTCANNGTATFTAAAGAQPASSYASGLTYTAANYASGTLGTTTLQCVPDSATQPITVQ